MRKTPFKKMLTMALAVAMLLSISLSIAGPAVAAEGDEFELQILFTSDLHGCFYDWSYSTNVNFTGLARVATKINELRNKNTILIDMGDSIQGNGTTIFHTDPAWEGLFPVVAGFEYLKYDAWVLGNHEFNFGVPALEKAYGKGQGDDADLFSGAVLAGNVFDKDDDAVYDSYFIKKFDNGLRVAIIGMTNPNIDRWDSTNLDKAGYYTESATKMTVETIKYLKDNDLADIFVAAEHMSSDREYDREGSGAKDVLADSYNAANLDLFIGAHGHGNRDEMIEGIRYVEIGANGGRMGQVEMTVTRTKDGWEVADKENDVTMTNITLSQYSDNVNYVASDEGYKAALKAAHDFGVANCTTIIGEFIGEPLVPDPEIAGTYEAYLQDTALIHLINEAMLHYTNAYVDSEQFGSLNPDYKDMAVTLSGTAALDTNANHKAGDITKGSVATIYKYDNNTLYIVAMTGAQFKQWMEWSYRFIGPFIANNVYEDGPLMVPGDLTIPYGNGNMPGYNMDQFEGVTYKVDLTKPYGSRIVNLKDKATGANFDLQKTYLVAVNNYRATTQLTTQVNNPVFGDGPKPVILAEETEKVFPATGEGMLGVMIDYIQNELEGVIDNTGGNFFKPNWEFITPAVDPVLRARAVEAVNKGDIALYPVNGNAYARRAVNISEVILVTDFIDVKIGDWYYDAIEAAVNIRLMTGTSANTFSPQRQMTRETLATLLYRLDGSPAVEGESGFTDVRPGMWYTDAIIWAEQNGVAGGVGGSRFGVGSTMKRQELATMLFNYLNYIECVDEAVAPDELEEFEDGESVAPWAVDAMQWMVGAGIIQGMTDGSLSPAGTTTRGQAAVLFIRVVDYLDTFDEEELAA